VLIKVLIVLFEKRCRDIGDRVSEIDEIGAIVHCCFYGKRARIIQ